MSRNSNQRVQQEFASGARLFTLVELLVVIAIIHAIINFDASFYRKSGSLPQATYVEQS